MLCVNIYLKIVTSTLYINNTYMYTWGESQFGFVYGIISFGQVTHSLAHTTSIPSLAVQVLERK